MIRATTATHPITMPTIASVESPLDDDDDDAGAIGALIVVSAGQNGNRLPENMVMDMGVATEPKASSWTVGTSGYWNRAPDVLGTPAVYETALV